ncbi:TPA: DNA-binding protein [Candidatus Acetothermia bacterium]|nr:DNA-binding protein [Candidatus Acetothermia bacterium]
MLNRKLDWLRQAKRDLDHARRSLELGDYEWACFAAQQAAEKALKALYQSLGGEARGHSVRGLLERLPPRLSPGRELEAAARELDKHYIPTRYPNSYAEGAPFEYYSEEEARRAISHAEKIIGFCEDNMV